MTPQQIANKLLSIQRDIDKAKTEKARMEGRLEALKADLVNDHKCKTATQAKKKIIQLEKELVDKKGRLKEGYQEFEERYEL